MTTLRILSCVPISILFSACFAPAPSYGSGAGGSTSGDDTSGGGSSTAPEPGTSTTSTTASPVDAGSGDVGGEQPLGSTSTGPGIPSDDSSSTSGDGTTGGAGEASSSGGPAEAPRTVFLLPYAGAPMSFEGLGGADALCQAAADSAELEGTYMAWLSAGAAVGVLARFSVEGGPFLLVDGTEVAADWDDLTDGTLDAPILVDAEGVAYAPNAAPERYVITHTNADGSSAAGVTPCSGFTGDSIIEARWGDAGATDASWTQTGDGWQCDDAISGGPSLYCFEQ